MVTVLSDLLNLRLHIHHHMGDFSVYRLRADGIDLPVHFLDDKIQLSADGLVGLEHLLQLLEVAPQPDCFLRHSDFISENRGFRQDALLIRRGICKNLIEF